MEFAKRFMKETVPIINKIKAEGYKVYIRGLRNYEDGVVPKSVFVPGLNGNLLKELAVSLYEYDDPQTDYKNTAILSYNQLSTEGWSEI